MTTSAVPIPTTFAETDRPVWDDEPALDLNRITQLRQLGSMGGTDLLGRVVELFARDGETSLGAIREAATSHSRRRATCGVAQAERNVRQHGRQPGRRALPQLEDLAADDRSNTATTTLVANQQLDQLETELANANRAIAKEIGTPR